MRRLTLHIFLCCLISAIATSCRDSITDDPTVSLTFSVDTLRFDTVFTSMGSTTLQMLIRNTNKKAVQIDRVTIDDGRYFLPNLDGETKLENLSGMTIRGNDSLFLFVKVNIDPQDSNTPVLIEDKINFHFNSKIQSICLEAYGQDVEILRKPVFTNDTTLLGLKPYLLYDTMLVACNLTIAAGATFYMYNDANIFCIGNLTVQGTHSRPVRIRGARRDNVLVNVPYNNVAGQWGGVYLLHLEQVTFPLQYDINYLDMNSGTIGLYCQSETADNLPTLKMQNCRIHNMSMYGLVLQNVNAEVSNSEISNCASYCVYLAGGKHRFVHNTVASYFGASWMQSVSREDVAALYINNLSKTIAPMESYFYNNIITGVRHNNLVLATPLPQYYTGEFAGNYLRIDTAACHYQFHDNRFAADDDTVFVNTAYKYKEYIYYDYHLTDNSPALSAALTDYLLPLDRDSIARETPVAGCYQQIPNTDEKTE